MRAPPRGAHPHPPAGGRGDGRRAAGAGTGRRHQAARARYATQTRAPDLRLPDEGVE
jgi:hypothetical protein